MTYKEKYEQALERAKSAIKECGNNLDNKEFYQSLHHNTLILNVG